MANPVTCPFCSYANRDGRERCAQCGMPVGLPECPTCDAVNEPSATRCYRCQTDLDPATAPSPPQAQHSTPLRKAALGRPGRSRAIDKLIPRSPRLLADRLGTYVGIAILAGAAATLANHLLADRRSAGAAVAVAAPRVGGDVDAGVDPPGDAPAPARTGWVPVVGVAVLAETRLVTASRVSTVERPASVAAAEPESTVDGAEASPGDAATADVAPTAVPSRHPSPATVRHGAHRATTPGTRSGTAKSKPHDPRPASTLAYGGRSPAEHPLTAHDLAAAPVEPRATAPKVTVAQWSAARAPAAHSRAASAFLCTASAVATGQCRPEGLVTGQ